MITRSKGSKRLVQIQHKTHLTIRDIRRIGRQPNQLSWDELIVVPKMTITQKLTKKLKTLTTTETKMSTDGEKKLERIVLSKIIDGKLHHLVKWKNSLKCVFIASTKLNHRWPQEVIKYYQNHLIFTKDFKKNTNN